MRLADRLKPFWLQFAIYAMVLTFYEIIQLGGTYALSFGLKTLAPETPLLHWAAFVIGLTFYKGLQIETDTLVDWTIHKLIYSIDKYLNVQAMDKFLEMRLSWHQKNNSGVLVGKVQSGVDKTTNILVQYCWEMIPTLIQAVSNTAAVVIFWWFGMQIIAVIYLSLIIFFKLTVDNFNKRKTLRERRHNLEERKWALFVENIQGISEIISTNQTIKTSKDFKKLYDRIERLRLREQKIGTLKYNRLRNWVTSIGHLIVMVMLIWHVLHGNLETADLFFLWSTVERLFHAFWRLGRIFDQTGENSEGFFRFDKLMNQVQEQIFASIPLYQLQGNIDIKIQGLEFGYNGTDKVIDDFNLTVPAGKTVAIVGPSGSGKSTLGKALKGFWKTRAGQILFNGVNMYHLTEQQHHDNTGIVSQADTIFIFAGSIRQNLLRTKPEATTEEIIEACTIANIHDEIMAMPNGYDTIVGEKGIHLSGGQKQRLAIARAILRNPKVLILDEPTSGLDMENETQVKQAIFKSAPGRTTIIIAHRLVTIRDADLIVAMQDGKIVEQGTHQELIKRGGVYAHLHELDQKSLKELM